MYKSFTDESDILNGYIVPEYEVLHTQSKEYISLSNALDFFYRSELYRLVRDGVSDMHCMSDEYLADELKAEYQEKNK